MLGTVLVWWLLALASGPFPLALNVVLLVAAMGGAVAVGWLAGLRWVVATAAMSAIGFFLLVFSTADRDLRSCAGFNEPQFDGPCGLSSGEQIASGWAPGSAILFVGCPGRAGAGGKSTPS